VAIPLIAMVGLLAYVASTTINNAVNLDRAPDLINATSLPTAEFIKVLQDERADAVVYLFQPNAQNQAAYATAVKASQAFQPKFLAAMNSPGTRNSEDAAEAEAIKAIIGGLSQLQGIRGGVTGRALTPLQALGGYNAVILNEPRLFLAEANSLTNAAAAGQALGLIATVSAREALWTPRRCSTRPTWPSSSSRSTTTSRLSSPGSRRRSRPVPRSPSCRSP
jgi:hypothetical protein